MHISDNIIKAAAEHFACTEITPEEWREMKYPRLIPIMRFSIRQYSCQAGNLLTMDTRAMGGKMQLSTVVMTPSSGQGLPVLLIDSMDMKNKSLMYVEYYDCTVDGALLPQMDGQRLEFAAVPDYAEKPAWYIDRRMPCSLIKGGTGCAPSKLQEMAMICVDRYLEAAGQAVSKKENLAGLHKFQDDMWNLGNPSSEIMTKVLGKGEAERFFRSAVLPAQQIIKTKAPSIQG